MSSTNEVLLRDSGNYPLGTPLLALEQTAGRGRAERRWDSTRGGMYLSVLFVPAVVEGLTLLGAFCVVRLLERDFGLVSSIRWPNDVYMEGRKVAGILPQVKFRGGEVERAVLGVGLNVSQSLKQFSGDVRERATTLALHLPHNLPPVEEVARLYLAILEEELETFEKSGCAALCARCEPFLEGLRQNAEVHVVGPEKRQVVGRVGGLGPRGELRLGDGRCLEQLGPAHRIELIY